MSIFSVIAEAFLSCCKFCNPDDLEIEIVHERQPRHFLPQHFEESSENSSMFSSFHNPNLRQSSENLEFDIRNDFEELQNLPLGTTMISLNNRTIPDEISNVNEEAIYIDEALLVNNNKTLAVNNDKVVAVNNDEVVAVNNDEEVVVNKVKINNIEPFTTSIRNNTNGSRNINH